VQQINPGNSDQLDEKPQVNPDLHEEIASIRGALNQTRTEISIHRRRMEKRQFEVDAHIRRTNALWVVLFLFAAGLGTSIWYGYRNKESLVVRFPAVQTLVNGAEGRLSSLEEKLNSWSQVTDGLQNRIAGLEQSSKSTRPERIPERATDVQRIANDVNAQMAQMKDANQNISSIQSRLGEVASLQQENSDGLNRLNGDVSGLRKDFTTMRRDYGDQIDQVQRENASTIGAISNLGRGLNSSSAAVQLLADAVNRNRIDFEVSRNKTEEVAPGIFLTVRETNVDRQQINGWLQISEDGRTVWFRDQGAQKVMTFTTKHDERSHELVFTHVGKQGVAGYLLIPMTTG
jgi:chromosome segregation ATPase